MEDENAPTVVRGVPKSGRTWRTVRTHRSSGMFERPHKTYDERMKEKNELEAVKKIERELKAGRAEKRRKLNEQKRLKAERKKENQIMHAVTHPTAQVVKDTKKLKKMNSKNRKKLINMPPEYMATHLIGQ